MQSLRINIELVLFSCLKLKEEKEQTLWHKTPLKGFKETFQPRIKCVVPLARSFGVVQFRSDVLLLKVTCRCLHCDTDLLPGDFKVFVVPMKQHDK